MRTEEIEAMSLDEVIAGFEVRGSNYKREEVDWAMQHREEIIPRLLAILDNVLAHPDKYEVQSDYNGHIYALMLLGHFGSDAAHQTIIQLLSLPGDLPYNLLGDVVLENIPLILLNTSDGSLTDIVALAQNEQVDDDARSAAVHAIKLAVAAELISREQALSLLGNLLIALEDATELKLPTMVGVHMADLCPVEWMDTIREAYEYELIEDWFIGLDSFEASLNRGIDQCLASIDRELQLLSLDNLHARMSSWACFRIESTAGNNHAST